MKIIVIDGQGGRMGAMLVEQIKNIDSTAQITAIGTNSIATAAMLRAGATEGATGENPVVHNATSADIIAGPIGIIVANALLGEITPTIAAAVASCNAQKVLIPVSKCNSHVIGVQDMPLSEYIALAAKEVCALAKKA